MPALQERYGRIPSGLWPRVTIARMDHETRSSLSGALAARDRHLAARAVVRTPAERLAAMQRLITDAWALLAANPEGMGHFMRRNFRSRSVDVPVRGEPHGA